MLKIYKTHSLFQINRQGTGVAFDKKRELWIATIMHDHKRIFIGRFSNKSDAIKARLEAEIRLLGEFAPQWEMYKEVA